jgi:hypothetical protein
MSFVIYARGHRPPDVHPRDHVVVFPEAAQAKVWLEQMERGLPEGFSVKSEQIDAIRKAAETDWQLPEQYTQWIRRFKWGTWDERHDKPEAAEPGDDNATVPRASKPDRRARAQRPDGYVTITELCASSGVAPSDARAALRASGRVKPEYGWAFDPKELPAIKKIVGIK